MDDNSNDIIGQNKISSSSRKTFANTIVGVLILGVISCALWENIISPFCSFVFIKFQSLFSLISDSYSDALYKDISHGLHEESSLTLFFFTMILTSSVLLEVSLLLFLKRHNYQWPRYSLAKTRQRKNHMPLFIVILTFICFIMCTYLSGQSIYINQTVTKTLNNIEIVSPFIPNNEYKILKSKFYTINNKDDYLLLSKTLDEIAQKNSLQLQDWP